MTDSNHGSGIQTLDRSYRVLDLVVRAGERGLTVAQLEAMTDLSTPTLYRLTRALRQMGLLRQPLPRGPLLAGPALLRWGEQARGGIADVARLPLLELAERHGDSFFLMVPNGMTVMCLAIYDGRFPARSYTRQCGDEILCGVGQASVAVLSFLGEDEQQQILDHNGPRLRRDYGIQVPQVAQAMAMCRHLQFTRGVEGSDPPEFTGIAVPVLDDRQRAVAAVSCCLRRSRLSDGHDEALISGLQAAASRIRQAFFGRNEGSNEDSNEDSNEGRDNDLADTIV
ncbi:MAG: helix-turn-helix domain-containing protein [Pseudomonadales bacterium]|nr:helix-turn-helix domain-containing protein [Pseudomonadales bacterium]